jgi:hypothetical protein
MPDFHSGRMRVQIPADAFMPRIRKTSSQPKRKPKKPVKIETPVYPEYIQNSFVQEVEIKDSLSKSKVDQYETKMHPIMLV